MIKILSLKNFNFWRRLINSWSFFFFLVIIADFFTQNNYSELIDAVSAIYIGILAIYVSNKEFERWYDRHEENHPGEFFVIVWSLLVGLLMLLDLFLGDDYHLPSAVVSSYIAVLTILVITNKSKELYRLKRKQNKK